jgi:hypothetical protein
MPFCGKDIKIVLETVLQPGLGSWSMNSNCKAFADSSLHNAHYQKLFKKRTTYSIYACGLESKGVCHIVL